MELLGKLEPAHYREALLGSTIGAWPGRASKDFPLAQSERSQRSASGKGPRYEHEMHERDGQSDQRSDQARREDRSCPFEALGPCEDVQLNQSGGRS